MHQHMWSDENGMAPPRVLLLLALLSTQGARALLPSEAKPHSQEIPSPRQDGDGLTSEHDKEAIPSRQEQEIPSPRQDEDALTSEHDKEAIPSGYEQEIPSPKHDEDAPKSAHDQKIPSPKHDEQALTSEHDQEALPSEQDRGIPSPRHDEEALTSEHDREALTSTHDHEIPKHDVEVSSPKHDGDVLPSVHEGAGEVPTSNHDEGIPSPEPSEHARAIFPWEHDGPSRHEKPLTPPPRTSTPGEEEPDEPSWKRSAIEWFSEGVSAYLEERWGACVRYLENALAEWRAYRSAHVRCRLDCAEEARRAPRLYPDDVDHLHFGEEMVRRALCLIRCKKLRFAGRSTPELIPRQQQEAFRSLRAYEYLQLCYFQKNDSLRAASAAFTFLSQNPDSEMMKHNLKYYLAMPDVDAKLLQNFEAEKYIELFSMGTDAYYQEDYKTAILHLEKSLEEYLKAEEQCRADCEGAFDQGWFPDYASSVANHFAYCLKCKRKCHLKLPHTHSSDQEHFMSTHYNYLQFAYYKRGDLNKACQAATSYLLFLPKDDTMLENMEYYKSLQQVKESMFKPRPEAVDYIKRHKYEMALLKFISTEFVFDDNIEKQVQRSTVNEEENSFSGSQIYKAHLGTNPSYNLNNPYRSMLVTSCHLNPESKNEKSMDQISENISPEHQQRKPFSKNGSSISRINKVLFQATAKNGSCELQYCKGRYLYNLRKEDDLSGVKRFSIDGLANKDECNQMVEFAKFAGVTNDGYEDGKSPHSSSEKFEGVSLGLTALMVHFGIMTADVLTLFLDLSERGRNMTADYFRIPRHSLYYSYTHLVCRTALQGRHSSTSNFSHQIHADNCSLQKDGRCLPGDPAYYWRDYSAILYLNNDFEGGEFIFAEDPQGRKIQSSVKPTCGRLVGFSSGKENLHGVLRVQKGQRCALGLWFTLDPQQAEWGRILIEQMLTESERMGNPTEHTVDELINLVHFDMKEAKLRMQGYTHNKNRDIR